MILDQVAKISILMEFVNSRHPDPRRVWKGGPEPQLMTFDPLDPLDPRDPGMSAKKLIFAAIYHT